MFKFCLICITALLPVFCFSQHKLSGKVTTENNLPVANATVQLQNTLLNTITDADGNFSFRNLKTQSVSLKVSSIGYDDFVLQFNLAADTTVAIYAVKKNYLADEVIITSTRVNEKSGLSYSIINKNEIEKNNSGKDMPFLLNNLPSVVVTSDAGTGVGYTGIRIRGSDATRINVSINGIPINDAESQSMYWVDMPDIATSTEDIQLQRGAGTSTNGAGAFGGSINIQTNKFQSSPYAQSSVSFGSFNTLKTNVSAGTGLLNNHWNMETRLSKISSDGYVDRGASDLKSLYVAGGFQSKNTLVKAVIFSGIEKTYQAWNGVPESKIKNDLQGMKDYIDRNYLDQEDAANLLNSGRTYNSFSYKNQTDNYQQDNYQLHFSQLISDKINFKVAAHYTKGKGYYEEFRKHDLFSGYGIMPDTLYINNDTVTQTNLVRQKWLDNDFYGATWSLNYENKKNIQTILGGAWNQYKGKHFNKIIWAQYAGNSFIGDNYYTDDALKTDFTIYLKTIYDISNQLSLFGDLQYRAVNYRFNGFDTLSNLIPQKAKTDFFNPKAGINFSVNENQSIYISASEAGKEPSRDDYVESTTITRPKSERMLDVECGYRIKLKKFSAQINYYNMLYKDQLVLTGKINDVGNYTRTNTNKSYREGIEMELKYNPTEKIMLFVNATLSKNKIKEFKEYLDNYDDYSQQLNTYNNTDIAYSPSVISASGIEYKLLQALSLNLTGKYISKQYLDNTQNNNRKLDSYFTSDFSCSYSIKTKWIKEINLGGYIYNLFNKLYESNGYTYSYMYGQQVTTENFYFPQAGVHYAVKLDVKM